MIGFGVDGAGDSLLVGSWVAAFLQVGFDLRDHWL